MKPEDFKHDNHTGAKCASFPEEKDRRRIISLIHMLCGESIDERVNRTFRVGFDRTRQLEVVMAVQRGTVQTLLPDEIQVCPGCVANALDRVNEIRGLLIELQKECMKAKSNDA